MKCESVTFEFWMSGGLTLSPTFQARISVKKSILFHHDSITNTQQLGGYGHSKLSYRIHEIQQVVLIVAGRSSVVLTPCAGASLASYVHFLLNTLHRFYLFTLFKHFVAYST